MDIELADYAKRNGRLAKRALLRVISAPPDGVEWGQRVWVEVEAIGTMPSPDLGAMEFVLGRRQELEDQLLRVYPLCGWLTSGAFEHEQALSLVESAESSDCKPVVQISVADRVIHTMTVHEAKAMLHSVELRVCATLQEIQSWARRTARRNEAPTIDEGAKACLRLLGESPEPLKAEVIGRDCAIPMRKSTANKALASLLKLGLVENENRKLGWTITGRGRSWLANDQRQAAKALRRRT